MQAAPGHNQCLDVPAVRPHINTLTAAHLTGLKVQTINYCVFTQCAVILAPTNFSLTHSVISSLKLYNMIGCPCFCLLTINFMCASHYGRLLLDGFSTCQAASVYFTKLWLRTCIDIKSTDMSHSSQSTICCPLLELLVHCLFKTHCTTLIIW